MKGQLIVGGVVAGYSLLVLTGLPGLLLQAVLRALGVS
jgi:hypothetical protein